MAKPKTTAELTEDQATQGKAIADLNAQINAIWALLRERMDGDRRVTRAIEKAREG